MKQSQYHATARRLRKLADRLEACSAPATARDKASLTRLVHVIQRTARELYERHTRSA